MNQHIAILGTVGLPANYGGFETLAENLVRYHEAVSLKSSLTVYCSSSCYHSKELSYLSARLKYVPFNANGVQSIPYDIWSLLSAVFHRNDVILLLGVSGAVALPLIRLLSSARIVTNIDGIEWRREKWKGLSKWFLRFSEKIAVKFSDILISDNGAISEYVKYEYGVCTHVIAYGGDHSIGVDAIPLGELILPDKYLFTVCRIEPENNVHIILEAVETINSRSLVIVGNWNKSDYGRNLRTKYASCKNLFLIDPIYDLGMLKTLRTQATHYIHGHSAGGTNPSLVEAMHFGIPVLAFDCNFNRSTTEDLAFFFKNSSDLVHILKTMDDTEAERVGRDMLEIAQRRYTWKIVAQQYFDILCI